MLHFAAVLRAFRGHEVVLVRVRATLAVGGVLLEHGHEVVADQAVVGYELRAGHVHVAALAAFLVGERFGFAFNGGFAGFGEGGSGKGNGEGESDEGFHEISWVGVMRAGTYDEPRGDARRNEARGGLKNKYISFIKSMVGARLGGASAMAGELGEVYGV